MACSSLQPQALNLRQRRPRTSIVIIDAERVASGRATSRQYRMAERRSGQAASNPPLPGGGRAIADTSRKSKSS
jgi:hypothetical protein